MFTQPVSSPPLGPTSTSTTTTTTTTTHPSASTSSAITSASVAANASVPSTTSRRLRGLSYLRNYTHSHILSREHSSSHSTASTPNKDGGSPATLGANLSSAAAATSSSAASTPTATRANSSRPVSGLTRSVSYTPASSGVVDPARLSVHDGADSDSATHGHSHNLTLVASLQEPLLSRTAGDHAIASHSHSPSAPSAPHTPLETTSAQEQPPQTEPKQQHLQAGSGTMTRARAATTDATGAGATNGAADTTNMPSIRFSAYYDPRASRPSLTFTPIARTLPTGSEVIKVGRYSERDTHPVVQRGASAAPVGFKSKVVSRRHCEFWCDQGKWYIRDVKSSSGTFLNHIRLSPPGQESKPYPLNDGDIVQLGIDFKGGEEMIFRCVKMRLELNRGWQNKPNAFNMTTHKRLRTLATNSSSASSYSQDCSICLNSIAPCQCLFVAPCSHTWHYKCIRALLHGPSYPIFICPNCRAAADLEAEVDDPTEEWQNLESDHEVGESMDMEPANPVATNGSGTATPNQVQSVPRISETRPSTDRSRRSTDRGPDATMRLDTSFAESAQRPVLPGHTPSDPIPITPSGASGRNNTRTPSPSGGHPLHNGAEGPITPRNDAGPWVFDGSAGGPTGRRITDANARLGAMSLNAAAEMEVDG